MTHEPPRRFVPGSALLLALTFAPPANADFPLPHLAHVFPPGGRPGDAVEVTIGGTDLEGTDGLRFDPPGPVATPVKGLTFKVVLPPATPAGPIEVRAVGPLGVSNPRVWNVDRLPGVAEQEPNDLVAEARSVAVGSAIDGRIANRSDVDVFRIACVAETAVTIDCLAARVDSPLDPVLTLFDPQGNPLATARTTGGRTPRDPRLHFVPAASGDYAVGVHDVVFEGSAAHVYRLVVHGGATVERIDPAVATFGATTTATARGRRLPATPQTVAPAAGESDERAVSFAAPTADAIETGVDPAATFLRYPRQAPLRGIAWRWPDAAGNDVRGDTFVWLTEGPVTREVEPNDAPDAAQAIPPRVVVAGHADGKGDWFRFRGDKGSVVAVDVVAERAGEPGDYAVSVWRVVPPGKDGPVAPTLLAEFDDDSSSVSGTLFDHSSHDPSGQVTLPESGEYAVHVADRFGPTGDAPRPYALSIGPPTPSFRVVAMPLEDAAVATTVRQGSTAAVQLFVIRSGGFEGPIVVEPSGLPPGVTATPINLPGNVTKGVFVVRAADAAAAAVEALALHATATLGDKPVRRRVLPATQLIPVKGASSPRYTRLSRDLAVAVRPGAPFRLEAKASQETVAAGSTSLVALTAVRRDGWSDAVADIALLSPPPGVTASPAAIAAGVTKAVQAVSWPRDLPPGRYSLVSRGSGPVEFAKPGADPKGAKAKAVFNPPTEPVFVTITPRLIDATLTPTKVALAPGGSAVVKVKVVRQKPFAGAVTVAVAGTAVSAPSVTVAPNQSDAELTLSLPAGATAATSPLLISVLPDGAPAPLFVPLAVGN